MKSMRVNSAGGKFELRQERVCELIDTARIRRKTMGGEKQQLDWDKIRQFPMQVANDIGTAMLGGPSLSVTYR